MNRQLRKLNKEIKALRLEIERMRLAQVPQIIYVQPPQAAPMPPFFPSQPGYPNPQVWCGAGNLMNYINDPSTQTTVS